MKIDQKTLDGIHSASLCILSYYKVNLKRGVGLCPFHDDKHASFTAKFDRNGKLFWKCQACGASGHDIISFVAKMENKDEKKDFRDIIKIASDLARVPLLTDDETEHEPEQINKTSEETKVNPVYLNPATIGADVERTNLYKYLITLWDESDVKRVMELYKCGLFREYKTREGKRRGAGGKLANTANCITFPSIDLNGNVHSVKGVPYPLDDHHRVKGSFPFDWYKGTDVTGCYFGTHLLPSFPALPVALVESEKTAIVGMLEFPSYVWIATQGKTQAKVSLCECMRNRVIHIFPDADGLQGKGNWSEFYKELKSAGYKVEMRDELISLLPAESKFDICDIIIWNKKRYGNK